MLGTKSTFARRLACCLVLAVLAAGFCPAPAWAQSQASTGQITGTVRDASEASVAGATVTARSEAIGVERSAITNSEGTYTIVTLPPGTYTVTVEASGFQTSTFSNVQVVVGRTYSLRAKLGTGGVSEEVTVTAGAVDIQTTRSEPDAVINDLAIRDLPINGRRFQDFVTLTPTAQVEPSRQQISLAGQRGINANINVDGVDYNNPFFGGIKGGERSNFAFTIPQESIREFQVVPSGYSAEFGRSTGGIVNAVTKSGTNEFHGSAFYFVRPKKLSRDSDFFKAVELGDPKNAEDDRDFDFVPTQHQWGGSIGGPIVKDKLFFFGAYEQQSISIPRQVVFSTLNSVTPNDNTAEALSFYRSQEGPFEATNDALALLCRIDWEASQNHRLNFRYNYSQNEGLNSTNTGGAVLPTTNRAVSNDGTEQNNTNTVIGQWTWIISPTLLNEFRGQFSREERPRLANSTVPNLSTSFANTGNRNFMPTTQDDKRLQLADSISWTHGDHALKVGVEYNYVDAFQTFGFNQFGQYNVPFNADVNVTLEQLSVGGPNANRFDNSGYRYIRQIGNLTAGLKSHELALFVQDSWRLRPNFTINYGLRWEGQYNPTPEANNTDLVSKVRRFDFPVGILTDPTKIDDATSQFAPRLGFAWDPWNNGKTVIRGYGGVYYARSPLLIFSSPINNFRLPPGDVSVTLPFPVAAGQPATLYDQFALIGIDLNSFGLEDLPNVTPEQIAQIAAALGLAPNPFLGANVIAIADGFENPRSYQVGGGVEHQLTEGLAIGADYTYVKAVHLERNVQANLPTASFDPADKAQRPQYLVSGAVRPIPTLRDVTIRDSSASSLYQALTLRAKFQRDWGQVNVFYVLSTNYSDDDNERDSGGTAYEDAYNFRPEYNYSNLDRRHQFTANPVFYLKYGFEVSAAIRLLSGTPFDARYGSDANRDTANTDRPYSAPGVPFLRNAFRNKPIYNVDMRVQKRFEFSENHSITVLAEFFNLFNVENITLNQGFSTVANYCAAPVTSDCGFGGKPNPNFLQIRDQNSTSKTFGQILTGNNPGAPFLMQLGVRYQF